MFNYSPIKRRSDIPTPLHLCKWLTELILVHRTPNKVLDPSAGDGRLTRYFEDIERIEFEIKNGTDFLKHKEPINVDLVICNPPFNGHPDRLLYSEVFLDHIIKLTPENTPIFIFCTNTFRLNNRRRSKRMKKLSNYNITSIISLPLNVFEGVNMFCEIIVLNFPELKSHYSYYLPEDYQLEQLDMSANDKEFDGMSSTDIDAFIKRAEKAKAAEEKKELKDLKASIKALIDNSQFTIKDVFPELFKEVPEPKKQITKAKPAPKKKAAPKAKKTAPAKKAKPKKKTLTAKFSNPANRKDEWTGRGARLPLWVSGILEDRKITKEQFKSDPQYLNPKHEDYEKFKAELSGDVIDASAVDELAKAGD